MVMDHTQTTPLKCLCVAPPHPPPLTDPVHNNNNAQPSNNNNDHNQNQTTCQGKRLHDASVPIRRQKRPRGSSGVATTVGTVATVTPQRKRRRSARVMIGVKKAKQRLDFSLCNAAEENDEQHDGEAQPPPHEPPRQRQPLSEFQLHFDDTAFQGGRTKKKAKAPQLQQPEPTTAVSAAFEADPTNLNIINTNRNAPGQPLSQLEPPPPQPQQHNKEKEALEEEEGHRPTSKDGQESAATCLLRGLNCFNALRHSNDTPGDNHHKAQSTTGPRLLGSVSSRVTWCPPGSLLHSCGNCCSAGPAASRTTTITAAIHVHTLVFSRFDLMIFQGDLVLTTIIVSSPSTTPAAQAPDSADDAADASTTYGYGCTDNGGSGSCTVTTQHRRCCIKLRLPSDISKYEADTTRAIFEHPHAARLMPQIHAHFETTLPFGADDSRLFHGICMDYIGHTVNLVLFPGRAPASSEEALRIQALYADAVQRREKEGEEADAQPSASTNQTDGTCTTTTTGTALRLVRTSSAAHGADLHTALAAACLEALQRLHRAGWVHGDTHLGNFLLDVTTWRVYIIDFERSFRCNVPQQHLLDVQELFGHASGALVSYPYNHSWDMREILPVLTRLHPAFPHATAHYASPDAFAALGASPPPEANTRSAQRRRLFHLLPVCMCFVHESRAMRLAGCPMCNSQFNRTTANYYYYHYNNNLNASHPPPPLESQLPVQPLHHHDSPAAALFFNFGQAAAPTRSSTFNNAAAGYDDDQSASSSSSSSTPVAEDGDNQEEEEEGQRAAPLRARTLQPPPALQKLDDARQRQRFFYYYHPQRFVDALFDVSLPRIASMVQRARATLRLEYVPVGDALVEMLPVLRHLVDFQGVNLKSKDGRTAFDEWFHEMMYGSGVLKGGAHYALRLAADLDKIGCHDLSRLIARTVTPHYLGHLPPSQPEPQPPPLPAPY